MKHIHHSQKAASGNGQPTAAMYYNDQKPDKIYYQGLALRKVGKEAEARGRFNSLISYGEKHLYDTFCNGLLCCVFT